MRLHCPYCGWRDHAEFDHAGAADVRRPDPDADLIAWLAYVYQRDNPRGAYREYWQHTRGCRSWITVWRDTVTHAVEPGRFADDGQYLEQPV